MFESISEIIDVCGEKVFLLPCNFAIHGKTILILDDVLTTGATTNECAKVLKENGARRVYVLAISRHV